ncbi:MAG: hypothetical protein ACT4PT_12190 [Methanobacteriota archaeon]
MTRLQAILLAAIAVGLGAGSGAAEPPQPEPGDPPRHATSPGIVSDPGPEPRPNPCRPGCLE